MLTLVKKKTLAISLSEASGDKLHFFLLSKRAEQTCHEGEECVCVFACSWVFLDEWLKFVVTLLNKITAEQPFSLEQIIHFHRRAQNVANQFKGFDSVNLPENLFSQ